MGILSRRPRGHRTSALAPALAVALALGLAACAQDSTAPYANAYAVRFSEVWTRFQYNYPLFDVNGVDWTRQWDVYEPRARELRTEADFVALLTEMLAPLHDSQVWLTRPDGSRVETYRADSRPANWDEATLREYAARASFQAMGPSWGWGRLGDVGYLALGSFEPGALSASSVDAVLDSLSRGRAIVIDVRMNAGGDMAICDSLAGRFTALQRSYGLVRFRQGSQSGVLSTPRWWGVNPRTPTFTRPVFLLTGRQTTGAAEQFVLALRTLSQVTVLGDTTAGSMGSSFSWDLGNGWTYTVSRFLWLTPEHAVIEGVGLAPAVYVRATPADFARHTDPVLDSAIARAGRVPAN